MKNKLFTSVVTGIIIVTMMFTLTAFSRVKAKADQVNIVMWEKSPPDGSPSQKAVSDFLEKSLKEKFPNYNIAWLATPTSGDGSDYRTEYDKALIAGTAPTLTHMFPYVDIPSRIANGTILDMTQFVTKWDLKKQGKVFKAFDQAISKDGKWYAIPHDAYTAGMVYNIKAIKAGGGDLTKLPKTWDQFAAMGKKITDKKVPRYGYALVGMDWCAWPFTPWVWAAGGEMVKQNKDGSWKLTFTEAPGVDALMFWHDMVQKYQMTQKDVLEGYSEVQDDMQSGRAAFGWGDPAGTAATAVDKYQQTPGQFGFMPIPTKNASIPAPVLTGGQVWTINPKATVEQQKAAWEIMQYLSYDEKCVMEQEKLTADNSGFNYNPLVRTDLTAKKFALAPANYPKEWAKEFADGSKNAKPEPYCPHWNDIKNALVKPIQTAILQKNLTRAQAQALLNDCANGLYSKFGDTFKK